MKNACLIKMKNKIYKFLDENMCKEKQDIYISALFLIMSGLVLHNSCFPLWKKYSRGFQKCLQIETKHAVPSLGHMEAAERFLDVVATRRPPVCKQLTPAVMKGPRPGLVCVFPWHGAFRPGWERKPASWRGNLEDRSQAFGLHLSLSPQQRRGRHGGVGGVGDRWVHPPPAAAASSIWLQPRQLPRLPVIPAGSADSKLHISLRFNFRSGLTEPLNLKRKNKF